MVDSVKAYNIGGVGSTLELGKQGSKIVGSADKVSLKSKDNDLISAEVANGTLEAHAVTAAQFDAAQTDKVTVIANTVNFGSGNVVLFTVPGDNTVLSVTVTPTTAWTGADSSTVITVGDDADPDRLFAVFDPGVQTVDETNHLYENETAVKAYITAGGASAGTAKISVLISGPDAQQ